jgi:hypothetical protein
MSKKKRPNQKPTQAAPATPAIVMQKTPVTHGNVFAAFVDEAKQIGEEVAARRSFQEAVGAFLTEQGLVAQFEAWRAARKA